MYKEFYLMQKDPFGSHPFPDLFYKSRSHKEAWATLVRGIDHGEPILLTTGGYGVGKTLLCLRLVQRLRKVRSSSVVVFLSSPGYSFSMVLEKILDGVGISIGHKKEIGESTLQSAVYGYFEACDPSERRDVYIVLDDVQEFGYAFLNKIRLFASYNHQGYFPVKVIMFGHRQVLKMLDYKGMKAFKQRLRRVCYLPPLNLNETREYIYFRLIYSGASGTPVFDDESIGAIYSFTGGVPRLINNVCDNVLLTASDRKLNVIDMALVNDTVRSMEAVGGIELTTHEIRPYPDARQLPDKANTAVVQAEPEQPPVLKKGNAGPPSIRVEAESDVGGSVSIATPSEPESQARPSSKKAKLKKGGVFSGKKDLAKQGFFSGKNGFILVLILVIAGLLYFILTEKNVYGVLRHGSSSNVESSQFYHEISPMAESVEQKGEDKGLPEKLPSLAPLVSMANG